MSLELFSIILLLAMFVAGAVKPINLGLMGLVAAFLLGTLGGGLSVDQIFEGYPGDLFVLLTGVTLLFAIAQSNGTTGLLVRGGLRLIGGNVGLMPWVMFGIAAAFTTVGAVTPAAVAIVAPVALRFADRYGISPFLVGVLVVQGANAGAFSPINPFAVIANGVLQARGLPVSPGLLFAYCLAFNALLAAAVYAAFGGIRLLRASPAVPSGAASGSPGVAAGFAAGGAPAPGGADVPDERGDEGGGLTWYRAVTLAGILLLASLTMLFDVDVGFGALAIALVLIVISPAEQESAFGQMPWSTVLLVTGIVTYVSVLESIGTFDYVEGAIAAVGSPSLAALVTSYVGGVISAFASTTAMLGAIIPLSAPILQNPAVPALGVVTAIALASSVVDISPFSTNGALLLANAQNVDRRLFFKRLLYWGIAVTALVPLIAWLAFVVLGSLLR